MAFAAGVPYVHAKAALAFDSNIEGFVPSPVGVGGESFATVAAGSGDSEETEGKPRPRRPRSSAIADSRRVTI